MFLWWLNIYCDSWYGLVSHMIKSEEWDIKEKNLGKSTEFMKKFLSDKRFRNKIREAEDAYHLHKKPDCRIINLLVRQNRFVVNGDFFIEILECRDCGWNYHKKWWQFWK